MAMMALEKQRALAERRMLERRRKAIAEFVREQLQERRMNEDRRRSCL